MATVTKDSAPKVRSSRKEVGSALKVSAYDQVASMLVALLTITGFVVGLMFIIWASSKTWWTPIAPIPVMVLEDVGGGGSGDGSPGGEERQFEEPPAEELAETAPAKIEDVLDAISLEKTVEITEMNFTELPPAAGFGKGKGKGWGDGEGDGSGPGTKAGIPAWERWEVRLNANTEQEYAAQLDFFQIELAVAGGGSPVVTYVSNVSTTPKVRTGNPKDERRLRFMHRSGALRDADRRILTKAKVDHQGKVAFQFYSEQTYKTLLTLENVAMKPRSISDVRKTTFGVRGAPGRYEFYVIAQEYR